MNTSEIARLGWDEQEMAGLVAEFVRRFQRLPSQRDLEQLRSEGQPAAVEDGEPG